MEKHALLEAIKNLVSQKSLSREEILDAYSQGLVLRGEEQPFRNRVGIAEILYYIGGFIVVIGIAILIWQNWGALSPFTRIIVTFGSGIAAYIVGVLLGTDKKLMGVGLAFHLISAVVTPLGLGVTFDAAGINVGDTSTLTTISGILFLVYLVSLLIFRKPIFTIFSIIFGTIFYFALTSFIMNGRPIFDEIKFTEYFILTLGVAYILLGYFFSQTTQRAFTGPLYCLGVAGSLGSALALGGWTPNQSVFWELIFPGLVFAVILLSVYLKSKAFLSLGALFLMGYIIKITAEYFANSLGWPFALVLAGFCLIAIGYLSFLINKKYL